jgi:RNA-binding protein
MAKSKTPEPSPKELRARGHHLKPVVLIGKDGITDSILSAVDSALTAHELVKVKLLSACLLDKDEAAAQLSTSTRSTLIQRVGRTSLLWRKRPEKKKQKEDRARKKRA